MIKLRASATLGLSAVFAAAIIGYSFYQAFEPGAVCQAIPVEATFVFQAENLEELLQSPVCAQLDKALGAGNTLKGLLPKSWQNLCAASEIAVADIPFRKAGQNKTWAASSWVGWRSPWLRWKLEHTRNKNLKLLGKHAVWPVWQYDSPDMAGGMSLTFALTDNLLLACLSEHPSDILLLLDTYDKRTPAKSYQP
ncbi:hypothetical protein [Pontiella sulfatireligans]|uniref:Uncharacterized protein n=1 Tax=Pontiella sulfatireligans TaxID=2750658 RepID=A0A6C2UR82_9BACT|nr:hypothetical protein [Pontiella sulfatireligans]VGO22748.1 hypothetical protein SCARR_04844 [Pontiella sulfatireligans]